jgi:hypothetical protein
MFPPARTLFSQPELGAPMKGNDGEMAPPQAEGERETALAGSLPIY